jgi:spore maturation protein CgeB
MLYHVINQRTKIKICSYKTVAAAYRKAARLNREYNESAGHPYIVRNDEQLTKITTN